MKAHVRIVQGVTVFPEFADDLNGVKQSYFIFSIDNSARYLLKIDFFLVLFLFYIMVNVACHKAFYFILFYFTDSLADRQLYFIYRIFHKS